MDNQPNQVLAAGGVLWRPGDTGDIEVVGVYRPATDNWSLPKGKLNNDEHQLLGACREVEEETGLSPVPQTYLTRAHYELPNPAGTVTKIVDFWLMRARDPHAAFRPCGEVSQQRWLSLPEAELLLRRPRDQQALQSFAALPPITSTVLLLRHARAQATEGFAGPDSTRPLDARGLGQSGELVPLLALYDPQRIITATPQRCVKTIIPLAAALGRDVEGESLFDAESHIRNPERASARLRELALAGGGVVCSQAPVIADSLAILADTDGVALSSVHTPVAGVWVLSFSQKTLVAVERLQAIG